MRIDILTLFPSMCESFLSESIIGRARKAGLVSINCVNIRDFSADKHRKTDDIPYGGGMGMVMTPQPIYDAWLSLAKASDVKPHVVYLTPKGAVYNQSKAIELSKKEHLILLCGHYEGVDQRVLDKIVDEEISLGDFVLTGGEIAAAAVVDSVTRLLDGVLADESCYTDESHFNGLLEYPQYTRPYEWEGAKVPEVLISGHHEKIAEWRRQQSLAVTMENRPDLLEKAKLSEKDRAYLENLKNT
jgi:tRNA (guanine-N(1)-)-methyltransferase